MPVRTAVAAVCAVAILVGEELEAQPSAVPAGARVRLIEAGTRNWVVGTIERPASGDTIWLTSGDGTRALPVEQVDALQVSRGKHRPLYYTLSPLVTIPGGALAFGMAGVFPALGSNNPDQVMAWSLGIGAAVGAVTGIVLATKPKQESWEPLSVNQSVVPVAYTMGSPRFKPGLHVRVKPTTGRIVDGTVIEQHGDTALLSVGGMTTPVDLSTAWEVAIDRGRSRRSGAKRGVMWGAGAGLAIGISTAATPNSHNDYVDPDCDPSTTICPRDSDLETVLWNTLGGAAIGAGIGALIGKREWTRVSMPRHRTSAPHFIVAPQGRRLAMGLTARF